MSSLSLTYQVWRKHEDEDLSYSYGFTARLSGLCESRLVLAREGLLATAHAQLSSREGPFGPDASVVGVTGTQVCPASLPRDRDLEATNPPPRAVSSGLVTPGSQEPPPPQCPQHPRSQGRQEPFWPPGPHLIREPPTLGLGGNQGAICSSAPISS